jgi:hypothetical protein
MSQYLTLRIVLQAPTPCVVYGLQKGKGSNYETIQKQRSDSADLLFEFTLQAKVGTDGKLVFLGPFAQGPPQDRFIYIDIGTYAGQIDTEWSRRLKIPLRGITTELISECCDGKVLTTKVPGRGRDGSPNCATVKPFDGWEKM